MPVFFLSEQQYIFPDPSLAEPEGLLALGGGLSSGQLVNAYASGIFPWYSEGSPILWWSPDPRCILLPEQLHIPKSLQKTLNRQVFSFSFDTSFHEVITQCAAQRQEHEGTWLVPEMIDAYTTLHERGVAHSVEVWHENILAGGLYGVSLGRAFFGESMFYRVPDASKAAVVFLVQALRRACFTLLDCQQTTPHMVRFGAMEVSRVDFLERLEEALATETIQGSWRGGIPV